MAGGFRWPYCSMEDDVPACKLRLCAAGEGGAGTWSDGKLTTGIGRNSQAVQRVLDILTRMGAPQVQLRFMPQAHKWNWMAQGHMH